MRAAAAARARRRARASRDEPGHHPLHLGHHRQPKGVGLSHRTSIANAWSMARTSGLDHTTQLAVLPLYHAHAFGFGLMSSLLTRRTPGLHRSASIPSPGRSVVRRRVGRGDQRGAARSCRRSSRCARTSDKVPTLRSMLVSSAPLDAALARGLRGADGHPARARLGPLRVHQLRLLPPARRRRRTHRRHCSSAGRSPSIGPPLPGTEVERPRRATGSGLGEGALRRALRARPEPHARLLTTTRTRRGGTLDDDDWLRTGDEGFFRPRQAAARSSSSPGGSRRSSSAAARSSARSPSSAAARRRSPSSPGKLVVVGFPHARPRRGGRRLPRDGALSDASSASASSGHRGDARRSAAQGRAARRGAVPRTHTGKVQRRKLVPLFAPYAEHRGPTRLIQAP